MTGVTARAIADFLGAELCGADRPVEHMCTIANPRPFHLAFAKELSPEHAQTLAGALDTIVLVQSQDRGRIANTHIPVAVPRSAFARVVAAFFTPPVDRSVASTACIHPTARIGDGAAIGEYCVIGPNAVIGDGTVLRHHVVVAANVAIGRDCLIKSHTVIGEEGFGISRDEAGNNIRVPHLGSCRIGNHVELGAFNTVASGTIEPTVVEDHVKTDDHVHIAHNCHVGRNTIITACAELSGSVRVGERVWLGPNCSIMNGVEIGDDALVGIGACVVRSVPPGVTVMGVPARDAAEFKAIQGMLKRLLPGHEGTES